MCVLEEALQTLKRYGTYLCISGLIHELHWVGEKNQGAEMRIILEKVYKIIYAYMYNIYYKNQSAEMMVIMISQHFIEHQTLF